MENACKMHGTKVSERHVILVIAEARSTFSFSSINRLEQKQVLCVHAAHQSMTSNVLLYRKESGKHTRAAAKNMVKLESEMKRLKVAIPK